MTITRSAVTEFAKRKLEEIDSKSLRRRLHPTHRHPAGVAARMLDEYISFSDNDYLGLSQDARVKCAAAEAAITYGAGAGASRLVTGDCPLYADLERKLADMKGTEAALVFGSGYLANISTIPVLAGRGDLVLLDELSHACMHAGAKLSGANIETFRHNDVDDLRRKLKSAAATRKLILTETVFSMDGDRAPLKEIHALAESHGAWVMTDDAHGFGIVNQANPAPIQMGTLSKAAGSYGGYVCGPRALIDLLVNRGRGFIYTTGLPPAALAASIQALSIMRREPERRERALANARRFAEIARLPEPQSAIVPVIFGEAEAALNASQTLLEQGFLVAAIRPPTVPAGTARLRIAFSAEHREPDVALLAAAVRRLLDQGDDQ